MRILKLIVLSFVIYYLIGLLMFSLTLRHYHCGELGEKASLSYAYSHLKDPFIWLIFPFWPIVLYKSPHVFTYDPLPFFGCSTTLDKL